jgi:hypothetical protein
MQLHPPPKKHRFYCIDFLLKDLTEQEFLHYFNHLATYLERMLQHEQNKQVPSNRLMSIKESLSNFLNILSCNSHCIIIVSHFL